MFVITIIIIIIIIDYRYCVRVVFILVTGFFFLRRRLIDPTPSGLPGRSHKLGPKPNV